MKSFECPKSIRNYEKNNAWNIRRLVDELFVPSTQRIKLKIVGFVGDRPLCPSAPRSCFVLLRTATVASAVSKCILHT